MSRKTKIWIGIGVAVLVLLLALRAMKAQHGDARQVRAEVVGKHDLVAHVNASGHIEAKQSVDISADISGRIVQLPVEEGDAVKEGDLLLEIDPTQYEAAVRQAQAQLAQAQASQAQARASYEQAQRDWDRMKSLKESAKDLVTDTEAEQARTKAQVQEALFHSAQHAVSQAQAAVEEAQDRLDKTVITAPISGRVTRLNVQKGETAVVGTMNNPGSLLLTVADLSVMEAVVKVDETDVPTIHVDDSTSVSIDAWPDSAFAGVVTKVASSAMMDRSSRSATAQSTTDQAVDFQVRIQLRNPPPGIRPDLSCTADIVTATRRDAISIPIIALTLRDTARGGPAPDTASSGTVGAGRTEVEGVFQVTGGEAHFRPVQVGIAGDAYFEVTAGLGVGDTVVAGPYATIRELKDGERVKLQKIEGAPPGAGASDSAPGAESADSSARTGGSRS